LIQLSFVNRNKWKFNLVASHQGHAGLGAVFHPPLLPLGIQQERVNPRQGLSKKPSLDTLAIATPFPYCVCEPSQTRQKAYRKSLLTNKYCDGEGTAKHRPAHPYALL
jgi:hypothetical protein